MLGARTPDQTYFTQAPLLAAAWKIRDRTYQPGRASTYTKRNSVQTNPDTSINGQCDVIATFNLKDIGKTAGQFGFLGQRPGPLLRRMRL